MSKAKWILVGGAAILFTAVTVGLAIWLSDGGGETTAPTLSHVAYARLWNATTLGAPKAKVLGEWPEPYQVYPDGSRNECFEWFDRPANLYNLCFKKGVLVTKSIG